MWMFWCIFTNDHQASPCSCDDVEALEILANHCTADVLMYPVKKSKSNVMNFRLNIKIDLLLNLNNPANRLMLFRNLLLQPRVSIDHLQHYQTNLLSFYFYYAALDRNLSEILIRGSWFIRVHIIVSLSIRPSIISVHLSVRSPNVLCYRNMKNVLYVNFLKETIP